MQGQYTRVEFFFPASLLFFLSLFCVGRWLANLLLITKKQLAYQEKGPPFSEPCTEPL